MPSFAPEKELRTLHSCSLIAGIDEAGRGPLAGPVYAAAVIIPEGYHPAWLNALDDSKKLTEKKREDLALKIKEDSRLSWAISSASVAEIEALNILQATYLAMARAAKKLPISPDFCLIDGRPVPDFPLPSKGLVKGDSLSYSIAAASILAKVKRDHHMLEISLEYPEYSFHKHKGYGTKLHLEALSTHGICPHHRKTFKPVSSYL